MRQAAACRATTGIVRLREESIGGTRGCGLGDERQRRIEKLRRAGDAARDSREAVGGPDEARPDEIAPPPRRPKGLPFAQYESWIDRQIRQAQERGFFDNLRGKGRPLAPDDPNVRAYAGDDALGLKILKDNEALPAWIELNREIEAERQTCRRILDYYVAERDRERRARFAADYHRKVAELNTKIDQYNLVVPARTLEQIRIRPELELRDADRRRWAALDG